MVGRRTLPHPLTLKLISGYQAFRLDRKHCRSRTNCTASRNVTILLSLRVVRSPLSNSWRERPAVWACTSVWSDMSACVTLRPHQHEPTTGSLEGNDPSKEPQSGSMDGILHIGSGKPLLGPARSPKRPQSSGPARCRTSAEVTPGGSTRSSKRLCSASNRADS